MWITLGEHLHPYTLCPALEDKCHGKRQIYTGTKDPDCTGINQNRHEHGRTVPQAQRPPADVSYLETEIHGIWQGSVNPSASAVSDQVNQSLSTVCLFSTFQIKHGFVYPQTMKKKGLTERVSPRHGTDRLRALRKRETDARPGTDCRQRAYSWNLKMPHNHIKSDRFHPSGIRSTIDTV